MCIASVVIPTLNRPQLLADAVESVLNQTVSDLECIVVDDCSTPAVVVAQDSRLRLLRHERRLGVAAARNTGLRAARGRYVAFLDDDDLYAPTRLEMALKALRASPIVICWRTPMAGADFPLLSASQFLRCNRVLNGDVHDVIVDGWVPSLDTVTVLREVAPMFDERFAVGEDADWWIRATRLAEVRTVPKVAVFTREGEDFLGTSAARSAQMCRLLLDVHADYFAAHSRAAAYRWRVLGGWHLRCGDRSAARKAFRQSLTARPSARTLAWLVRAASPW